MEGYIKKQIELTNEMSYDTAIKNYGIEEFETQDLTVSINNIILAFYKKSIETKQVDN